jgi:pimeloyl-ACP methyl ester carboxylesterase
MDADFVSKVWNRFDKPVMALHSGEDEFVPPHVDKQALIEVWKGVSKQVSALSGLIPGASHTVDAPEAQDWLANRVAEFVSSLGEASGSQGRDNSKA